MKNLTTPRLLLRGLKFSDVNEIVELDSAPETAKYASLNFGAVRVQSRTELKKQIKSMVRDSQNKELKWVIESKEDGKFVGLLTIGDIPNVSPFSLSYRIKSTYWSKGITTEAVARLLRFVFDEMKVSNVAAAVHVDNVASQKVLDKTGFQKTGFLYGGINQGAESADNPNSLPIKNFATDERRSSGTYFIYKAFYPGSS